MAMPERPTISHLFQGVAFVATGAFVGLWAPTGLIGVFALLLLMRVCWLEDNITNDLVGRDELPDEYVNTAIRNGNLLRRWFGVAPATDIAGQTPHQLATGMRAETQIWACMLLGLAATLTAQVAPFGAVMNLIVASAIFVLALRRVDKLMISLRYCAAGRELPTRLLLPARPAALRDDDIG
ncbi:MAG: hypothetical protein AAF376_17420 [Pseudomonadota bacterium]